MQATQHTQILQLCLGFAPDVNQRDACGRSALHYACAAGKLDQVQLLLQAEAIDVDAMTLGGETPLMCAARSGNIYLVGECLNQNFNPFVRNCLGETAADQAQLYKGEVYGENLTAVIGAGIKQWQQQVAAPEIERVTPKCPQILFSFNK